MGKRKWVARMEQSNLSIQLREHGTGHRGLYFELVGLDTSRITVTTGLCQWSFPKREEKPDQFPMANRTMTLEEAWEQVVSYLEQVEPAGMDMVLAVWDRWTLTIPKPNGTPRMP